MKVLILGSDGYIGYPLTLHLLKQGHRVMEIDNYTRRQRVFSVGGSSLTPILGPQMRKAYLTNQFPNYTGCVSMNLNEFDRLQAILNTFQPDAIVHLAEQPSAAWSMKSMTHALVTQEENVLNTLTLLWLIKETCPHTHLVKLGSMGEYGTPECDIPEGMIPEECLHEDKKSLYCPMKGLPFPRTPGSFYHLSKVHDTYNIIFACNTWGLTSTDIMQGVVFGLGNFDNDSELTRFDYDEYFGTVINRFCVQAICNHPLTIYGTGDQQRGFLPLQDSIQCLTLAIENPPNQGEYRTLNQFESVHKIRELAKMVQNIVPSIPLNYVPNPRTESLEHYYNPTHEKLFQLGYVPTTDIQGEITKLVNQLKPYAAKIKQEVLYPTTHWK